MKFLITEPRIPRTYLSRQLLSHWHRATHGHSLSIYENLPYEVHGQLLTRLWNEIRYDQENLDRIFIISETDFVIQPSFVEKLKAWPWREKFLFVPFITRKVVDNQPIVVEHQDQVGAWFIAMNLMEIEHWPPLDWLSFGGSNNDAANNAFITGCECNMFTPELCKFLEWRDLFPPLLGIDYPKYGCHLFFARHLSDPAKTQLLPGLNYTVGDHTRECLKYLLNEAGDSSSPSAKS